MTDPRFTTDRAEPATDLSSIWPFPGTLLLVVFGVWLFYMGAIAELEDVRTAFFGLGAVTVLVILLSLRAMAAGRVRRRRAMAEPTRRRRRHAGRGVSHGAGEDFQTLPRRSSIVDEGVSPAEGAIYPGVAPSAGSTVPLNARMRSRQDETRTATLADEADPAAEASGRPRRSEPTDAVYEPTDGEARAETPPERQPVVAESVGGRDDPARLAPLWQSVRQVEAGLNRERAERGAQFAKLDGRLKSEAEELKAAIEAARPAAADPDRTAALAAAVEALTARLDALEARPISAIAAEPGAEGDPALTITQFDAAVNGQLLPRLAEMIEKRVATALDPETLRQRLGADGAVAERLADATAAVAEANEAAQAEREAIREEMTKVQRQSQRALTLAMNAHRTLGAFADGEGTVAEQLASLAGGSGGTGAAAPADGQLAAMAREVEELRGNLGAVTQHIARMGEHYQDLLARLDRIGGQVAPEGRPAPSGSAGVEGEVEALRDALTTIIEQNREIRAQQEMLSARFEGPRDRDR